MFEFGFWKNSIFSVHESSHVDFEISWYNSPMKRVGYFLKIQDHFRVNPVLALLGPRQCGKTTLAKDFSAFYRKRTGKPVTYFDLEDPVQLANLAHPKLALEDLTGLVVIDEVQRAPELFPVLRVLVDQQKRKVQYLILGSASR